MGGAYSVGGGSLFQAKLRNDVVCVCVFVCLFFWGGGPLLCTLFLRISPTLSPRYGFWL